MVPLAETLGKAISKSTLDREVWSGWQRIEAKILEGLTVSLTTDAKEESRQYLEVGGAYAREAIFTPVGPSSIFSPSGHAEGSRTHPHEFEQGISLVM
jgi:hypothetical protein